ncbi:YceI family protein [Aureimonas sp. AU40]|uniref:YceI family protein n=1 Tax=Aureimonas sp. AU40 TaxID=1637747 RepID=UPI000A610066
MMRTLSRFSLIVLATFASSGAGAAVADGGSYRIAPTSSIGFHVGQVGGGGIDGTIKEVSGQFRLDPSDPARASVSIDLKAASVATGQPRIDAFLQSEAVFDADAHPDITFRSTRVVQTGARTARIEGTLTAHGVSRPETFQAELTNQEKGRFVFHVVGDIYRTPYGMGVGTPIYSNVVNFDMRLEGQR